MAYVPGLFHVSDAGPLREMTPRPSPTGTSYAGRPLVWAVDAERLVNYLLPRDCPRVCWLPADGAARVVAVEAGWVGRLGGAGRAGAGLHVHRLDPAGFRSLDEPGGEWDGSGYWVSDRTATVVEVSRVDDCRAALAARGADLLVVDDLWPLVDQVVSAGVEFSAIRMRNAAPRRTRSDCAASCQSALGAT